MVLKECDLYKLIKIYLNLQAFTKLISTINLKFEIQIDKYILFMHTFRYDLSIRLKAS